jgi:hypothetical protein
MTYFVKANGYAVEHIAATSQQNAADIFAKKYGVADADITVIIPAMNPEHIAQARTTMAHKFILPQSSKQPAKPQVVRPMPTAALEVAASKHVSLAMRRGWCYEGRTAGRITDYGFKRQERPTDRRYIMASDDYLIGFDNIPNERGWRYAGRDEVLDEAHKVTPEQVILVLGEKDKLAYILVK